jgi:hypothetical protein
MRFNFSGRGGIRRHDFLFVQDRVVNLFGIHVIGGVMPAHLRLRQSRRTNRTGLQLREQRHSVVAVPIVTVISGTTRRRHDQQERC